MSESKVTLKLAVVGGGGVGKSALTLQLVKQQFCEDYDPTIEDSHRKQVDIDGQVTMLEIFDTAGQEELSALRDQALRVAEGFLLVFAITDEISFNQIEPLHSAICRAKDSEKVPMVLVGNKADLIEDRSVSPETINALTKKLNMPFFEASAKKFINVEESFYQLVRLMRQNVGGSGKHDAEGGDKKPRKEKSKPACSLL